MRIRPFIIKNTGDKPIGIADLRVSASAATRLQLNVVSGTAANGSAITLVPRNLSSTETPTAIIESGTDITGLTSEGTQYFIECPVANTESHLLSVSNIIITKGTSVGLLVESGAANITGTFSITELE